MAPYNMMDEVVHFCTKCKMDLNHRITRVEAGKPKRVLCLTCNTERSYRDRSRPSGKKEGKAPKRSPSADASKGAQEMEWRNKINRGERVPKPYDMEQPYDLDDLVEHKLFGIGLVVERIPPDKAQIYFPDGLKTMKCGRKTTA